MQGRFGGGRAEIDEFGRQRRHNYHNHGRKPYERSGGRSGPYRNPRGGGRGGRNDAGAAAAGDASADVEKRLSTLIAKVGDKAGDELRSNLDALSGVIQRDYSKFPDLILKTLRQCVLEFPWKVTIYGTLLGLINSKSYDTGATIVNSIYATLNQKLEFKDWSSVKVLLRFFAVLVSANAINSTTMISIYNHILKPISENANNGGGAAPQQSEYMDNLVYVVLSTLPWAGKQLQLNLPEELERLMGVISTYVDGRRSVFPSKITHIFDNEPSSVDGLTWLKKFVSVLPRNEWNLNTIVTPYDLFENELSQAMQHSFPPLTLPPPQNSNGSNMDSTGLESAGSGGYNESPSALAYFRIPRPTIQIFDYDPKLKIQRFIIQDLITDSLNQLDYNRKECARCVLGIHLLCLPNVAKAVQDTQPNTANPTGAAAGRENADGGDDDQAVQIKGSSEIGKPLVIERLIMETVLTNLLSTPSQHDHDIFLSSFAVELCKLGSDFTFHIAGSSIRLLYNRLPQMDAELINRFSDWFSTFISNFGYQWTWKDWEEDIKTQTYNAPQKTFITESISKIIRLSYFERIKQIMPQSLHQAMPPKAPGPKFKFTVDVMDDRTKAVSVAVGKCIKAKGTADQVNEILDEHYGQWDDLDDEQERTNLAREMLIQHVLLSGSKTFSHMLNAIERYMPVLQKYSAGSDAKLHIAKITEEFWILNPQMYVITLDKLLNYRVIDPITVVEAVFDAGSHLGQWNRFHYWEALHNTVQKVNLRVDQLEKRIAEARKTISGSSGGSGGDGSATKDENDMERDDNNNNDDDDDLVNVSYSQIEQYQNTLTELRQEQKNVIIKTIEKFVEQLNSMDAIVNNEQLGNVDEDITNNNGRGGGHSENADELDHWWLLGRYREFLRLYRQQIKGLAVTLDSLVFSTSSKPELRQAFEDICQFTS
ncbi:Nuclear cap-binding protein subunit 1 [Mycoemilia scoparia]|uniref:Nuclear cap-binding protein subunit 1 n=1 Tax=Mycoemilia scoparia TaxID=417184 RepID=A0A9W8DR74_9FUNG|nr:Nuclear cap-binding protein subunit 1 [Mycoemilia scoparia]